MATINAPTNGGTTYGTQAADTINGSSKDDNLIGLGGDDVILGGEGNDVIEGDGQSVVNLASAIGALGSYMVPFPSNSGSQPKPSLKFLGNTADNLTVWQVRNNSDTAITITLKAISDAKFPWGDVPFGPVTYTIPPHTDLVVASPSSHTMDLSQNGVNVADADPHLNQTFTTNVTVSVATGVDGNDSLFGGNGNDTIRGWGGNDNLHGDAGNDTLDGGTGNDVLEGGSGNDTLIGGDGVDTADYSASASLVNVNLATGAVSGGDAQGDTLQSIENLNGSAYNDILTGDAGANAIFGGKGDDLIVGGAGADKLDGGDGVDTLSFANASAGVALTLSNLDVHGIGENFSNALAGGLGGDALGDTYANFEILVGSAFDDKIGGAATAMTYKLGAGNDIFDNSEIIVAVDTVYGEDGNDTIWTGAGDDLIDGGAGNDRLFGEVGKDTLIGGTGDDSLDGGAGNDKLDGGSGVDTLRGGDDSDLLVGGAGADTLDGGLGNDTADYSASALGVKVNLTTGLGAGGDAEGDKLSGIENLTGSKFDDVLTGDFNANILRAGDGKDVLVGSGGGDILDGGADTDTVDYSGSAVGVNVNLAAGTGAGGDKLISIENIVGTSFVDILTGNAGANVIRAGAGNDVLVGSGGGDVMDGGADNDTADYSNSTAGVVVNLTTGLGSGGFAQGDKLNSIENVTGSAFGDVLTGDASANILRAGDGKDVLVGSGGGDIMDGGAGNDTADYSNSDASVKVSLVTGLGQGGFAEGDKLSGIENLTGSKFDDVLTGDTGVNVLTGGAGNDVLIGGFGADVLDGGDGIDTADYSASAHGVTVNLTTGVGAGCDANGDTLISIENIIGSKGNDTLTGNAGANILIGGDGKDHFWGSGGGDTFDGGSGKDWIDYRYSTTGVYVNLVTGVGHFGMAEGDTYKNIENIRGSAGDDTLIGDDNANVIYAGSGKDHVEGGGGNDMIYSGGGYDFVDGGAGLDTLSYADSWTGVVVNLGTGVGKYGAASQDTIINIENLNGSKFDDSLTGDAGNNTLNGAAGDDKLFGAVGNDILIGGSGADALDGGDGMDTASYANSHIGVTVSLATGGALNADASQNGVQPAAAAGDVCPDDGLNDGLGSNYVDASYTAVNGVTDATGDTFVNVENLLGSAWNDKLAGDNGDNKIDGGAGNDAIDGGAGIDYLLGNLGNDTLTGGLGADVFVFTKGFGQDTITDFWAGANRTDRVWLQGTDLHSFNDVLANATEVNGGVMLKVDAGADSIFFAGLHLNQFNADDFIFT